MIFFIIDNEYIQMNISIFPIVSIIYDYSNYVIAVIGNTEPYTKFMKQCRGAYSPGIKLSNGDKCPGWFFGKNLKTEVENLVNDINTGKIKPMINNSNSTPDFFRSGKILIDFIHEREGFGKFLE